AAPASAEPAAEAPAAVAPDAAAAAVPAAQPASGSGPAAAPSAPAAAVAPQPRPAIAGAQSRGRQGDKGKFREPLWFKKGEIDAAAAQAAQKGAPPSAEGAAPADHMPIEDRYTDDGSITNDDQERFSLKTGATQAMPAYRAADAAARRADVSNEELI